MRILLAALTLLTLLAAPPLTRAADPTPAPFTPAESPAYKAERNLPYKSAADLSDYEKERCKLDLYLPAALQKGYPTLVWLYGGGLTGGTKDSHGMEKLAAVFTQQGIAFAAVNYRLSPKATYPAYVDDAASAYAWVHSHIAERGGDPARVFLGGHSAGAYLTSLVGMDVRYLQKYGVAPETVAGYIPVSGQMLTHFQVRKEKGIESNTITSDEAAPIFYTRKVTQPFLIIMGDHDWPSRWEENLYFVATNKAAGNDNITAHQIPDRTHGSIVGDMTKPNDPAAALVIEFITKGLPKPATVATPSPKIDYVAPPGQAPRTEISPRVQPVPGTPGARE